MATKTFEELKQMAIQIRDEKTNKQNTATRIGTQMVEHLNKLEQEYYNKENIDEQKEQTDAKFSELEKGEKVNLAKSKFFVSRDIDLNAGYGTAADFYGLIIQKVRVDWDKNSLPDTGQKWAITYLYVRSSEDKPYPEFDGRLTFTMLENSKVKENASINIYDYGYIRGYKGILEISSLRPYPSYNLTFDITLDCSKLIEDRIYQFGNMSGHSYEGKVYILPQLYFDATKENSFYYDVETNAGNDFPAWISEDISRDLPAIKLYRDVLLYAEIITTDDIDKYTYELAYINKTETNTEVFDNCVQLIRRLRTNIEATDSIVSINHIEGIKNGEKFWLTYQWDNANIRLFLDASKISYSPVFISNNISESPAKNGKQYFDRYCYKHIPSKKNPIDLQVAKVIGENLYIGAKYDKFNDILITFRKCMFNNLMTFAKIGLAENNNTYPLYNPERDTYENLNVTSSDNIGPIAVSGNGWCGGNHSYAEQNSVKTAETISYEFYADGIKLDDGDIALADTVTVIVKNRIYNPTVHPEEGADILSEELCIEDVIYKIENGNIFVSLSQSYTNNVPVTIENYYGMQSMCDFENAIMTPGGMYSDFTDEASVGRFYKSDYPDFRRFIERKENKLRYQSTYLLPFEAGKHDYLNSEDFMFTRSYGKSYHHLLSNDQAKAGDVVEWAGLYTWFAALQDDEYILAYKGKMNGKIYLFIDAKKAISETYILIPTELIGKEYTVVEKSNTIITVGEIAGAKGLKFGTNAAGSLILSFTCRIAR